MVENRLKFDRDVLAHGADQEDMDYDDWDPFLDLDDDELEAVLRKLHTRMDSNSDGYVDREELIVWSLVAMYNIAGHDASEDWSITEMNDDHGEMTFQDVIDELYTVRFEGDEELHSLDVFDPNDKKFYDYNRLYNRDMARFTGSDINGNGMLDRSEWILFNNPLKDEAVKDAIIAEGLGVVDTNKDGKLSLEEYLADWHTKPNIVSELEHKIEVDAFKDEMDRDGNGFLEKDELIYWIHPENSYNAVEEADHLIDMCDENDDAKLTADEIIEETDLWLESVGTEYGQSLRYMDEL